MKYQYRALGRGGQSGAALIVVLMMLVVITLLGLASMRGAIMQERMAANTISRAMAFQAAEAGLRQAEIVARDGNLGFPSSGCNDDGLCATPLPNADAPWAAASFWVNGKFRQGSAVSTVNGSITPRFVIENFGTSVNGGGASDCIDLSKPCIATSEQSVFRITSYAATATGAEVIVQSLYRR